MFVLTSSLFLWQRYHSGFTAHRNTDGATDFMVEKLHFPSKEAAQELRDEYFLKYHSTAKVNYDIVSFILRFLQQNTDIMTFHTHKTAPFLSFRVSEQLKKMEDCLNYLSVCHFSLERRGSNPVTWTNIGQQI